MGCFPCARHSGKQPRPQIEGIATTHSPGSLYISWGETTKTSNRRDCDPLDLYQNTSPLLEKQPRPQIEGIATQALYERLLGGFPKQPRPQIEGIATGSHKVGFMPDDLKQPRPQMDSRGFNPWHFKGTAEPRSVHPWAHALGPLRAYVARGNPATSVARGGGSDSFAVGGGDVSPFNRRGLSGIRPCRAVRK